MKKLYVAGQDNSNPRYWSLYNGFEILLADSIEEAETLTNERPIVEIKNDESYIIYASEEW